MLTKRDVEKIQLSMTNELNASSRSVLVCALLLLLLFGVAWFGAAQADAPISVAAERTR